MADVVPSSENMPDVVASSGSTIESCPTVIASPDVTNGNVITPSGSTPNVITPSRPTSNVTFVTGFYDIGRKTDNAMLAYDNYFAWIAKLLALPINLVFFTTPEIHERLQGMYEDRHNLLFRLTDTYPWIDRQDQIAATWDRYQTNNPVKDTPAYACIMIAKFVWLQRAIEENPFGSTHYAWIDAGLFKVAPDLHLVTEITPPDALRCIILNHIPSDCLTNRDRSDRSEAEGARNGEEQRDWNFIRRCQYTIAGGMFTGSKESMIWFAQAVLDEAETALKENAFGLEQEFMAMVYRRWPERFDPYFGDFRDIVRGYHRMTSWDSSWLVQRFVQTALSRKDLRDYVRAATYLATYQAST